MNISILNTEIQDFINKNLNIDASSILLKGTNFKDVTTLEIIEQIEAKVKCIKKLPTWFSAKNIYYPNKLNIEQTSSEIAAMYKAQLFSGNSIIDITGGFGVDSYYFSKVFDKVTHCEINKELSAIVNHNFNEIGVKNIKIIDFNGIDYLSSNTIKYDWIYVDPSRRHDSKGKVFFLKDCQPDIPTHLKLLLTYSNNIAIKTSPLLDLTIGINELKHVSEIHIIAIKNEVKELVWILENNFNNETIIKTVNILEDFKESFSFTHSKTSKISVIYEKPLVYLYEPNAAILKSGGFNNLAQRLNLSKLHQNSHLYTSDTLINFPGRCFKIESVRDYNKKTMKILGINKANLTTRNFPETVQQIRKKYKIKDGGQTYIFFTTNYLNKKIIIICTKIT